MDTFVHRQRGFNLIELMIGLAIGLFGLLAMSQIMLTFSQQRNTTTQSMSAQNNGVMALYLLERDLGMAGYAMMRLQNCDRINYYFSGTGYYNSPYGTATLPGAGNVALTALAVRIHDGGSASDTIEVQYGNSLSGIPGTDITVPAQTQYSDPFFVFSPIGFVNGDKFVANVVPNGAASGICTMGQVSGPNPVTSPIAHAATGAYPYNVAAAPGGTGWKYVGEAGAPINYNPATDPKTPFMANLGNFVSRRYTVAASGATAALNIAELPYVNPPAALVDEIVFMKAQYGLAVTPCVASTTCVQVATWSDATNFTIDNTNGSRVIAVRVGIVARSPLYEKDAPVGVSPTLSVLSPVTGTSTVSDPSPGECSTDNTTLEVKCTVADSHYRYKVFSTIVPLKNSIWNH